jgi:alkylation response protein AidB-like acyl-CoA dehydrogenase
MLLKEINRDAGLRETYADFGRCVVQPNADTHYDLETLDVESWHALADAGFWRIPVAERFGGQGYGWNDFAVALEGLASGTGDLGFLLSVIAHAGLLRAVAEFGSPSQQARLLPALTGGAVGATAITEATGGSDVAAVRSHAVRTNDGYRLTGEKQHITNAPVADVVLLLGRIPELGRRDITIFLVETSQEGVLRLPAEHLFGLRTSPTGTLTVKDVELPADAVLGQEGAGLSLLYNVISFDRVLYGLIAAAYLQPLLDVALDYATGRRAFGARLVDHEYIQVSREVSRSALDALVRGRDDASLRCSVAKFVGSESLVSATRNLMCVLGHHGYVDGLASRCTRDALGTLIAGGTTEMQRKNIFNQMLRAFDRAAGTGP